MPRTLCTVMMIVCLALTVAGGVRAETVTIAGSGGMIPLLTILADAYMKKYPHDSIQVNQTSITQSGGILAARSGAVDIGMSARQVQRHELDETIAAYHFANVAAVVAVHGNVQVTAITVQQLCDIYAGRIGNWRELGGNDAPIIVLTRPEADSTKLALRDGIACFRKLQETAAAVTLFKSHDMLTALQRTPDTIGIIDTIALEQSPGKTHPLRLDGRSPTAEEVAGGSWPIIKKYTLIIGKEHKKAVDRFMRFIRSREGTALIMKHGGVPLSYTYP